MLDAVAAALTGIRGAKSQAKAKMRAPLSRVVITGPASLTEAAQQAQDDLRAVGTIVGDLVFVADDDAKDLSVTAELAPTED